MEGPSLVIACEELKPYLGKKILAASGTASIDFKALTGKKLLKAESWGKHLLLTFTLNTIRIHFLMFGSYRIDDPRENRIPKLELNYAREKIYFYSCAVKTLPSSWRKDYDWTVDLMSKKWDAKKCLNHVLSRPQAMVCDILMDQSIFSGLGNIMKNEILFNLRLHPETKIENLSRAKVRALVKESERYAWKFYEWKKKNVLKRNWQVMRKKTCPVSGTKITKRPTGKLKRLSHFCLKCQKRPI